MMIDTELKRRIRNGEQVVGVSAPMTATRARLEEIVGADQYDFVSVDSQHGAFSEERLVEFCGIASDVGIPVHLRIKHTRHTYLIGNLLDLGPAVIEVPQTEIAETAQEAVDYFYYPRKGRRSWGGAARYGIDGREDRLEYASWWNDHGVLWLQVESVGAITRIRDLAMPGIDCFSWGPADLSFSREAHPYHPLQSDDDWVRYALSELKTLDARLVVRSYDPALRDKYRDMGVTVLLERPKV